MVVLVLSARMEVVLVEQESKSVGFYLHTEKQNILLVAAVLDITLALELVVPVVTVVVALVVEQILLRYQMGRLAPEVVREECRLVEQLNTEEDQELLLSDMLLLVNLSKTQD